MQNNISELISMLKDHNCNVDKINKRLTAIVITFAIVICVMAIYIICYK